MILFIHSVYVHNKLTAVKYNIKILGLRLESQFRAAGPELVEEYISF